MHKIIQKIIAIIQQLLEDNNIDTKTRAIQTTVYLITDEDSLDDLLQRNRKEMVTELGAKVFVTVDVLEEKCEAVVNHKVLFTDGVLTVLIY